MKKILVIVVTLLALASSLSPALAQQKRTVYIALTIKHDSTVWLGKRCTTDSDFEFGRRAQICSQVVYRNKTNYVSSVTNYYMRNWVTCFVGAARVPCDGVAFVHRGTFDEKSYSPSVRLSCGVWRDGNDEEGHTNCGTDSGADDVDWFDFSSVEALHSEVWPGFWSSMYYVHVDLDDGQSWNPLARKSAQYSVHDGIGK